MRRPFNELGHQSEVLKAFVNEQLAPLEASLKTKMNDPESFVSYHFATTNALRHVLRSGVSLHSQPLANLISQIWDANSSCILSLLQTIQAQQQIISKTEAVSAHELSVSKIQNEKLQAMAHIASSQIEDLKHTNRELKSQVFILNSRNKRLESEALFLKEEEQREEDDLVINPVTSTISDLSTLLDRMTSSNTKKLQRVNDLDRLMTSNVVSVLWREERKTLEQQNSFLEKMETITSTGTQTDPSSILNGGSTTTTPNTSTTINHADFRHNISKWIKHVNSVKNQSKMTLPKSQLCRMILQLIIEKLDSNKREDTIFSFLKSNFNNKYGLESLAESHLLVLFNSCLHYLKNNDSNTWEDWRIKWFTTLCGINNNNNTTTNCNVFIDFIGDLVELERSLGSLEDVIRNGGGTIVISKSVVSSVWTAHFDYLKEQKGRAFDNSSLDFVLNEFLSTSHAANEVLLDSLAKSFDNTICNTRPLAASSSSLSSMTLTEFCSSVFALDILDSTRTEERNLEELYNEIGEKKLCKETFVKEVSQYIMSKRSSHGIRTNGIPMYDYMTKSYYGGKGEVIDNYQEEDELSRILSRAKSTASNGGSSNNNSIITSKKEGISRRTTVSFVKPPPSSALGDSNINDSKNK